MPKASGKRTTNSFSLRDAETRIAAASERTTAAEGLQSTLSIWTLESDSEILFVGDAGTTEPSRPSRRVGLESANFWKVNEVLTIDADYSLSHARFSDSDPAGDHVPGAIESAVALGATARIGSGGFASLRGRYFGARPLIEDDSVRSDDSLLFNAELGWSFGSNWQFTLEALNLFDSKVNDIEYYYASRLASEAPGSATNDIHFHPAEPFQVRLGLRASF